MAFLTGLSAFPITPSDANGRVDVSGLRHLLSRLTAATVDSIGLLGSTGSYAYLSREERRRAVETAVEAVDGAARSWSVSEPCAPTRLCGSPKTRGRLARPWASSHLFPTPRFSMTRCSSTSAQSRA
jgi:Dihydrodipicolinate synthetase family